ncbi:MAG: hypothetical protein U9P90_01815, partial [Patescibacteria group bacterium]|nr:hypothetical protein [Patescibacteria group bacterium]
MKVFSVQGVVQEGAGNDFDVYVFEVTLDVFAVNKEEAKNLALRGVGIPKIGKVISIKEKGEIEDSLVNPGCKIDSKKRVWHGYYSNPDNPY